jgi:hypothetical protein
VTRQEECSNLNGNEGNVKKVRNKHETFFVGVAPKKSDPKLQEL